MSSKRQLKLQGQTSKTYRQKLTLRCRYAFYLLNILSYVCILAFNKLALEEVNLISHNVIVISSSALICIVYLVFNGKSVCHEVFSASTKVKWLFFLYAPVATIFPIYCLAYSQQRIPLGVLSFLSVGYFAFTHIWSHLLGVNTLYRHEVLKIACVFAAAAMFFRISFKPEIDFLLGLLSALMFAILVGLSHALAGVIRKESPLVTGSTIAVLRLFPAGIYTVISAIILGIATQYSAYSAAAGVALGIFSFSLYISVALNGANETSTTLAAYPIPTFIIAVIFFNNTWSTGQIAAGGLMLLSILLLQLTQE